MRRPFEETHGQTEEWRRHGIMNSETCVLIYKDAVIDGDPKIPTPEEMVK